MFTDSSARVVRRITPAGLIERVAGTGQQGSSADGIPAVAAKLDLPWGIAVDAAGNVFVGDTYAVRVLDQSGVIRTAGPGTAKGLALDDAGNFWLATGNTMAVISKGAPPIRLGPAMGYQSVGNAARNGIYRGSGCGGGAGGNRFPAIGTAARSVRKRFLRRRRPLPSPASDSSSMISPRLYPCNRT